MPATHRMLTAVALTPEVTIDWCQQNELIARQLNKFCLNCGNQMNMNYIRTFKRSQHIFEKSKLGLSKIIDIIIITGAKYHSKNLRHIGIGLKVIYSQ